MFPCYFHPTKIERSSILIDRILRKLSCEYPAQLLDGTCIIKCIRQPIKKHREEQIYMLVSLSIFRLSMIESSSGNTQCRRTETVLNIKFLRIYWLFTIRDQLPDTLLRYFKFPIEILESLNNVHR